MSVANQKKDNEISRNSLIVKAISLVKKINPKIFIFENVRSFLKTVCLGSDKKTRPISDEIHKNLSDRYTYLAKILNFKNYGSNSSRTRIIVIGVRKDCIDQITPFECFPNYSSSKTLREVIGMFPSLKNMDDYDEKNPLHHFKKYDIKMRSWIHDLKEGESAMDNELLKRPHYIKHGKITFAKGGFGDKYKRQIWDKEAPCIHTANGCLASQNTIHPIDDRVFSIAELMAMMTIPKKFKWDKINFNNLNSDQIKKWLTHNENNIRECIGEAVPTNVFYRIAKNIKNCLLRVNNFFEVSKKFENENLLKYENAAFYTTRVNLTEIYNLLPNFDSKVIRICEPSAGVGNFLLPLFRKYESYQKVFLTLVDIDMKTITVLKEILKKINVPNNFEINVINTDFLNAKIIPNHFDLIIGNPPFKKLDRELAMSTSCKNIFELFWKKSLMMANSVIMISPKILLSSPTYKPFRDFLKDKNITDIVDFGELGFKNVKIETIAMKITNNGNNSKKISVLSVPKNKKIIQDKNYIFDDTFPYWIIYRDKKFDDLYFKMKKDIFKKYKNYKIIGTKCFKKNNDSVWIIRLKNIKIDKPGLIHLPNYDRYTNSKFTDSNKFYKFIQLKNKKLFLMPTLTYYPRVIRMPKNVFVNKSILIVELKDPNMVLSDKDLNFFYSKEFRNFYSTAFNYATRTLNIDNNTIKFFGKIQ